MGNVEKGSTPPHVIKHAQEKAARDALQKAKTEKAQYIIVTGVDIPFQELVGFLVKLSIAAVPAGIIAVCFWVFVATVFGGVLAGL